MNSSESLVDQRNTACLEVRRYSWYHGDLVILAISRHGVNEARRTAPERILNPSVRSRFLADINVCRADSPETTMTVFYTVMGQIKERMLKPP